MHTVRCGFNGIPTVRFGALFRNRKTYGAVRCGFSDAVKPTCGSVGDVECPMVRLRAAFRNRKTYGAVRCVFQMT